MRFLQTGTGPGNVIGAVQMDFYLRDKAVAFDARWDGEPQIVPALPAVAFDRYFPTVRRFDVEGRPYVAQDAQRFILMKFENWMQDEAKPYLQSEGALLTWGTAVVAEGAEGTPVARASLTVRTNEVNQRLWGETSYPTNRMRRMLDPLVHQALWNWVAAKEPKRESAATLLRMLEHQFAHYRDYGLPSDFRMREIGRAPFAAWRAVANECGRITSRARRGNI